MAKWAVLGLSGCQTAWVVYSMSSGLVLKRDSRLLWIITSFLVVSVLTGWRLWSHAPVSTCMWIWPLANAAGILLQAFLSARPTATNGGSSLTTRAAAFTTTTPPSAAQSGTDPRGPISYPSHNCRPWGAAEISRGLGGPSTRTTPGPRGVSAAQGARDRAHLYLRRTVTPCPELSRPVKRTPSLSWTQKWTADFREKEAAQNRPQTAAKTHWGKPFWTFSSVRDLSLIISRSHFHEREWATWSSPQKVVGSDGFRLHDVDGADCFNFWPRWLNSSWFLFSNFSRLSAHSIWPKFSYYCLWTVHGHLRKLLPNGETLEHSVFTLAWLSGRTAPNSKSFTDPHHVLCFVVSSKPPSLPSKPDSRHAT